MTSPVCCESFPKTTPSTPKFTNEEPQFRSVSPIKDNAPAPVTPEPKKEKKEKASNPAKSNNQVTGLLCPYSPQKGKDCCPRIQGGIQEFMCHLIFDCDHSVSLTKRMSEAPKTDDEKLQTFLAEFKSAPALELASFCTGTTALSREDVLPRFQSQKDEINIGVSLGNRWFTPVNLMRLLVQALSFNNSRVTIMMADSLNSLNSTGNTTPGAAVRKCHTQAVALSCAVRDMMLAVFDEETRNRVRFMGYNDLMREHREEYRADRRTAYAAYEHDAAFKKIVDTMAAEHVRPGISAEKCALYLVEEAAKMAVGGRGAVIELYPHHAEVCSANITKFMDESHRIFSCEKLIWTCWKSL